MKAPPYDPDSLLDHHRSRNILAIYTVLEPPTFTVHQFQSVFACRADAVNDSSLLVEFVRQVRMWRPCCSMSKAIPMRALNDIKIMNKVALVLSTLICVSGATSVVGYNSLIKQEQTAAITEHTYKVVGALDSIMAAMVDQETGMRGYLISADEAFLAPQKAGRRPS